MLIEENEKKALDTISTMRNSLETLESCIIHKENYDLDYIKLKLELLHFDLDVLKENLI